MAILSIQSHVAYGHVGNAVVVFLLQRLGFEVWPVMTVQLSNHRGYESSEGQAFDADHIGSVIRGIEARGVFGECQAVLSGYLGDPEVGETCHAIACVLDPARHDPAEMRKLRLDVDGDAMQRHPALHPDAERGDLVFVSSAFVRPAHPDADPILAPLTTHTE